MKLVTIPILLLVFSSHSTILATPHQRILPPPLEPQPQPQSLTLIDLLSQSTKHTLLLKAIQRARLVPTINKLNSSTLFAPTDDAIRANQRDSGLGLLDDYAFGVLVGRDNQQLQLRDTILYHLLNYTLFPAPIPEPEPEPHPPSNDSSSSFHPSPLPLNLPTLHETLLFPRLSVSPPLPLPSLPGDDDPDSNPPNGLLKDEGQKVRVIRKEAKNGKKTIWVGGDWKGNGGVEAVSGSIEYAANGVMISLEGVLERPVDLGESGWLASLRSSQRAIC